MTLWLRNNLRLKFTSAYSDYHGDHCNEDIACHFVTWNEMLEAVSKLEVGKATGSFVKAQHIFNGSPSLMTHFHLLYNGMLQHSYVPHDFLCSTISPVIKDASGDVNDSNNYRPITLGSLFLQLFERVLLSKIDNYLVTDDLQFGFKRKHSTSHALYVLKSCIEYFVTHGSNVFVTFLDCSKAFDKISHNGLFLKLLKRGVPLCFLNIIIYWFSNLMSRCRWMEAFSAYFDIPSGIKQGGIISPHFFNIYIDDLIKILRKHDIGCHVMNIFLACVMFADDLSLVAPTRGAMQQMILNCEIFCEEFCLSFNAKKTKTLIFGKTSKNFSPAPLYLNKVAIDYVQEWKYLGCLITAGNNFSFSAKNDLRSFYCSANSILPILNGSNEPASMFQLCTEFNIRI
jgi:hypothetical protein